MAGSLAPALAVVLLVGVPVALTVFRGSLGERPVQLPSEAIGRMLPAIEAAAAEEPVVVANSTVLMDSIDLGLPVLLARKGIPWIERDDPRAVGRDQFLLTTAKAIAPEPAQQAIRDGKVTVVASSGGSGNFWDGPSSNLVLLRVSPNLFSPEP
jgi:hypothetical protein